MTFGKNQIQPNVILLLKTQTQSNTVLLHKTHTQPTQPTRAPPQSSPKPPRPKVVDDLHWSVRDDRDMDRTEREQGRKSVRSMSVLQKYSLWFIGVLETNF